MDILGYNRSKSFYAQSLLISWSLWFLAAFLSHAPGNTTGLSISLLGLLGLATPLVVALSLILPERELKKDLYKRVFNLDKVNIRYIVLAFFLMPVSILTAQGISLFFGYGTNQFYLRDGFTFTSGVFPVWFLLLLAPAIEELAWHSYGTDCLRQRFNLLNTSLIFAIFWGVWHLPLSFIKDYYHSNLLQEGLLYSLNFFLSLFPFVIIMNWLYYRSGRNILITIIFHITAGYFNEIFNTHPMSKVIQTILLMAISIFLIIHEKSFFIKTEKK